MTTLLPHEWDFDPKARTKVPGATQSCVHCGIPCLKAHVFGVMKDQECPTRLRTRVEELEAAIATHVALMSPRDTVKDTPAVPYGWWVTAAWNGTLPKFGYTHVRDHENTHPKWWHVATDASGLRVACGRNIPGSPMAHGVHDKWNVPVAEVCPECVRVSRSPPP